MQDTAGEVRMKPLWTPLYGMPVLADEQELT